MSNNTISGCVLCNNNIPSGNIRICKKLEITIMPNLKQGTIPFACSFTAWKNMAEQIDEPYDDKWKKEIMKFKKEQIINMLANVGKERDEYKLKLKTGAN